MRQYLLPTDYKSIVDIYLVVNIDSSGHVEFRPKVYRAGEFEEVKNKVPGSSKAEYSIFFFLVLLESWSSGSIIKIIR